MARGSRPDPRSDSDSRTRRDSATSFAQAGVPDSARLPSNSPREHIMRKQLARDPGQMTDEPRARRSLGPAVRWRCRRRGTSHARAAKIQGRGRVSLPRDPNSSASYPLEKFVYSGVALAVADQAGGLCSRCGFLRGRRALATIPMAAQVPPLLVRCGRRAVPGVLERLPGGVTPEL